jgi:hypothetical protein
MGLFDTIIGELECPHCKGIREREIQTKRGPCLMETYYIGDTVEPFYFGDYWFEEEWHCEDCYRRDREKDENAKPDWHKAYVHCINGLIVEISISRTEDRNLPDWDLIHRVSRDRHNYRGCLLKIDGMIKNFRSRKEEKIRFPFDIGPKTTDELFERIQADIAGILGGESPGFF